uniref:Uncharacterized protein n=1 Tax=Anguilla anguilla TaxID=7936 RepID=A0A0E9V5G5_ANGAN
MRIANRTCCNPECPGVLFDQIQRTTQK